MLVPVLAARVCGVYIEGNESPHLLVDSTGVPPIPGVGGTVSAAAVRARLDTRSLRPDRIATLQAARHPPDAP
jgi:hypothetical protein